MLDMLRRRVGDLKRGSGNPVVGFWVGSMSAPKPTDVSSVIVAMPSSRPPALAVTAALLYVVVPTPPWRAPTPRNHWPQWLEMSRSQKNAVGGRSSSPAWSGG